MFSQCAPETHKLKLSSRNRSWSRSVKVLRVRRLLDRGPVPAASPAGAGFGALAGGAGDAPCVVAARMAFAISRKASSRSANLVTGFPSVGAARSFRKDAGCQSQGRRITGMTRACLALEAALRLARRLQWERPTDSPFCRPLKRCDTRAIDAGVEQIVTPLVRLGIAHHERIELRP